MVEAFRFSTTRAFTISLLLNYSKTYRIQVYHDFKEIEGDGHRAITRFYDEREEEINQLEFREYFEILVAYSKALFEIGHYEKQLEIADKIIEISIMHNIQLFQEEDVYFDTLFRKAAAYFHLMQYDKADYILRELLKMNPYHEDIILFLKRCLRKIHPEFVKNARAISILLFLLSALIICIEVLVVRPFFNAYSFDIELIRNAIFIVGVGILIGSDLYHRWKVEKEVNEFVKMIKEQQLNNE